MKQLKLFFALFAMLALNVGNAWGAEAKFGTDWNSVFGTSYSGSISGVKANQLTLSGTVNSVSLVATNGTSTNGYVKTGDWRLYNGYTLTLTAPANHNITAISAKKGGKTISGISTSVGNLTIPSGGAEMSWTGSSNQVVFSITATMGFSEITVTYSEGSGSTPTPDPEDPDPENPTPETGGETVTYVLKDDPNCPANATDWFSGTIDQYTGWTATKGGSNNPKYYTTGTGLRVYNGGTFTITSTKVMLSITLTFSGDSYTFSANTTNPQTVTPNAQSYEWSVSRTCRLQKIEITYAADAGGSTEPVVSLIPKNGCLLGGKFT